MPGLPWPREPRKPGPDDGVPARPGPQGHPGALRTMPLRRRVHAPVQPEHPGGPGHGVLDLGPRPAPEPVRRPGRRDLRGLPQGPSDPAAVGPGGEHVPAERSRDVRGLPLRPAADDAPRARNRPARKIPEQRSRPPDLRSGRPLRAGVQRLPRQPRRRSPGRGLGPVRVWTVPRGPGRLPGQQRPPAGVRAGRPARLRHVPRSPRHPEDLRREPRGARRAGLLYLPRPRRPERPGVPGDGAAARLAHRTADGRAARSCSRPAMRGWR